MKAHSTHDGVKNSFTPGQCFWRDGDTRYRSRVDLVLNQHPRIVEPTSSKKLRARWSSDWWGKSRVYNYLGCLASMSMVLGKIGYS